jgi:nitrate reductase gamma subunit
MKFSKRVQLFLRLVLVFLVSFAIVFLAIFSTQSAYSKPSSYIWVTGGMDITLGPPPNSTNIPLDTTITVDALASASYNDLHVNPQIDFASVTSETTGPLTYRTTFYPDKLLKPTTSYHISVTIMNAPISWSFTTTNEPFNPRISYYLATNVSWISLSAAAAITVIAGLALLLRRRKRT